jgi:hypothetical protein
MTSLLLFFIASAFLFLSSCSRMPAEPETIPDIEYTITKLAEDSLHVVMKCHDQVTEILLPPFQADNPELPLFKPNIHHPAVSFSSSSLLIKKKPWGDDSIQFIEIAPSSSDWTFSCDITFPYKPAQHTLLPGPVNGSPATYYRGNFLFPLPGYSNQKPILWRTPKLITVHVFPDQFINIDGLPSSDFILQTPNELLFLQFTANALPLTCAQSGLSMSQAGSKILLPDILSLMCRDTRIILDVLHPLFPPLGFDPAIIVQDSLDGLEGTFSLAVNTLDSTAYGEWGSSTLAHESLHFWIGVYTGEYGDPWWKEGTT